MPFHFPLQAIFHLRQSLEHQQELRLRAANQQVARARYLVEQVDLRIREVGLGQSQALVAGTTAAELRFDLLRQTAFGQQRIAIEGEIARLEKFRNEQQRIFYEARRQRETLESLRNLQLREYQKNARRREQNQIDDVFLMRRIYSQRG
jgi:flagellar export protein FliJ